MKKIHRLLDRYNPHDRLNKVMGHMTPRTEDMKYGFSDFPPEDEWVGPPDDWFEKRMEAFYKVGRPPSRAVRLRCKL